MKNININLTKFQADALSVPLFVALENAKLELQKAHLMEMPPVVEWLEARCEALQKLIEAIE